ncbi:hypothetical protein Y032_0186g1068 [Ancylostoma ceylanicum]|uniref:Uncharacterized protein n=1 Tax=Ancylostoma ceylanicum TaxID=53326 RepID=A0A016SRR7_9BILA|nr:hypothetical protein Y032_0186g1068 [Ancylostoma ceylanicum]
MSLEFHLRATTWGRIGLSAVRRRASVDAVRRRIVTVAGRYPQDQPPASKRRTCGSKLSELPKNMRVSPELIIKIKEISNKKRTSKHQVLAEHETTSLFFRCSRVEAE